MGEKEEVKLSLVSEDEQVENEQSVQKKKIDYDQLKIVAEQAHQQAEMWRQRAMEATAKFNRIELIVELLKVQTESFKNGSMLFSKDAQNVMANELVNALYPPNKGVQTETTEGEHDK